MGAGVGLEEGLGLGDGVGVDVGALEGSVVGLEEGEGVGLSAKHRCSTLNGRFDSQARRRL